MKVLILVSCVLALASAGYAPVAPYQGPQHIPVIHNGVPVETPEVQHAKANHLAALAQEVAQPGYQHDERYDNGYNDNNGYNNQGYNAGHNNQGYNAGHNNQGYNAGHNNQGYNVGYNNQGYNAGYNTQGHGFALQHVAQPAVQHAAPVHAAPVVPAYSTSHVVPSIGHDGKPLDTPEVEAAKAHHFAAVHDALSRVVPQGPHYRHRRGIYAQHIPVIGHNGVPVDTFEVQQARAEHLAAHVADVHKGTNGYAIHQKHAPVYGYHDDSHYVPAISHDGTPLDTPEVEHAKAAHFAAHHEAAARNAHHGYGNLLNYGHGIPVDTLHHY